MSSPRKKIGLALSGGGFRASLYHLGLVRFLRDAGILPQVSQITSVSGGRFLAAHLVLNWDRYNGSAGEFDAAASEVLAFVRLDVRNRIVRRFPLSQPLKWARRVLGRYGLPASPAELHRLLVPVDVAEKFARGASGEVQMAFGKHRGRPLALVAREDPDYMHWIMNNVPLLDDARELIHRALAGQLL